MDLDFYTKTEVDTMLNGLKFEKISQEDFDALTEKDMNTIYYVYDEKGKITQYIGNAKISGGGLSSAIATAAVQSSKGFSAQVNEKTETGV